MRTRHPEGPSGCGGLPVSLASEQGTTGSQSRRIRKRSHAGELILIERSCLSEGDGKAVEDDFHSQSWAYTLTCTCIHACSQTCTHGHAHIHKHVTRTCKHAYTCKHEREGGSKEGSEGNEKVQHGGNRFWFRERTGSLRTVSVLTIKQVDLSDLRMPKSKHDAKGPRVSKHQTSAPLTRCFIWNAVLRESVSSEFVFVMIKENSLIISFLW